MITICSACGLAAKNIWPEIYRQTTGKEMPFRVKDFSEFITNDYLLTNKLTDILHAVELKATYHDPCTLRRGQGIYIEPRQLLKAIPKLDFFEMPGADNCCGGGGGLRMNNLELSQRILNRKLSLIKEIDVKAIVTSCPTCIKQMRVELAKQGKSKLKVLHIISILEQSLKDQ